MSGPATPGGATPEKARLPEELRRLLFGHIITHSLSVVAKLGVADVLASGPSAIGPLAARVEANEDALYRFMRALATVGVFVETSPRTFAQTPLSELLCENAQPSFRSLAMLGGGDLAQAWCDVFETAKTGAPAFPRVFGKPHFDYMSENPEALALFTNAMAGSARALREALLTVNWTGTRRVVDVGGGNGSLLLWLLERQPALEGVVFDLPEVVEKARANVLQTGYADRCSCTAGSFLVDAPPPGDTYILSRILHDWDDDKATTILRGCRKSIEPGGRLIILDEVVREDNSPQGAKILDLTMLVILGGRERTLREWESLFAASGFALKANLSTPSGGLLEATPI